MDTFLGSQQQEFTVHSFVVSNGNHFDNHGYGSVKLMGRYIFSVPITGSLFIYSINNRLDIYVFVR